MLEDAPHDGRLFGVYLDLSGAGILGGDVAVGAAAGWCAIGGPPFEPTSGAA